MLGRQEEMAYGGQRTAASVRHALTYAAYQHHPMTSSPSLGSSHAWAQTIPYGTYQQRPSLLACHGPSRPLPLSCHALPQTPRMSKGLPASTCLR
ncbi:hypothetical protein WJX84_011855 [Apatococcus fuscideae]|uniref:Uncharacterized protein n=1 Tax=Apatococcus fuscideae TaxID=2026836 RepID=A0AAW1SSW9_9CHLO